MAQFTVYAFSINTPVANCTVRVTLNGIDQSTKLTGGLEIVTGADGQFRATLSGASELTATLPNGSYAVIASAPGYQPYLNVITIDGTRLSTLTVELVPYAFDEASYSDIAYEGSAYVSPLYAVEVEVAAASPAAPWEIIEATLTDERGTPYRLEVETFDSLARLNLQARLILEPLLHLVGDDAVGLTDPDFSASFEITFDSLTPSGRTELPGLLTIRAANVAPTVDENDLINFTNDGGLADWLTPWSELPKFRGHYADAMIWLPVAGEGDYVLDVVYQDINRANPTAEQIALPDTLFAAGKAVRIRIPDAPDGAFYAQLTVRQGTEVQSKPLLVRYHG